MHFIHKIARPLFPHCFKAGTTPAGTVGYPPHSLAGGPPGQNLDQDTDLKTHLHPNKGEQKCPLPPSQATPDVTGHINQPPMTDNPDYSSPSQIGGGQNTETERRKNLGSQVPHEIHEIQSDDEGTYPPTRASRLEQQFGLMMGPNFNYDIGDCFFQTIQYLTGHDSNELRSKSMSLFKQDLISDPTLARDRTTNPAAAISSLLTNAYRTQNLPEYLRKMSVSCRDQGQTNSLWADMNAVEWVEAYIEKKIHIFQEDPITKRIVRQIGRGALTPEEAIQDSSIKILFSGPSNAGHYEPLICIQSEIPYPQPIRHSLPTGMVRMVDLNGTR